jgi:FAD/FMN-containing dehydrogenase
MTRRELIAAILAVPMLRTTRTTTAIAVKALRSRVRPGDPRWPSAESWAALSRQVGGNLIQPVPFLEPCRTDRSSALCGERRKALRNPYALGDDPSGSQVSGWLDAWEPRASAYAVVAENAADVAAAVRFARDHDLRLVVKGGGHSYQGTSNAPDSLLVWMRRMRAITLHDRFIPMLSLTRR